MFVTGVENKNEKKAPELLLALDNVTAVEGRTVRFRCKVAAYPQPLVTWYKDGKKLQASERRHIGLYFESNCSVFYFDGYGLLLE